MNLLEFVSYWSRDGGCFLGPWLLWAHLSYPHAQIDSRVRSRSNGCKLLVSTRCWHFPLMSTYATLLNYSVLETLNLLLSCTDDRLFVCLPPKGCTSFRKVGEKSKTSSFFFLLRSFIQIEYIRSLDMTVDII